MRRPVSVLLACIVATAWLPGCTRAPDATAGAGLHAAPQDAAHEKSAHAAATEKPAPPVHAQPARTSGDTAPPPGAWTLQESDPPGAAWGPPGGEGVLAFRCDRTGTKLVLDRQAVGVADDVRQVTLEADGTRIDYPAERADTTLAPQLQVRIALDATIVDRLLAARRMSVVAGDDTIHAPAPGESLRAVVDACRRIGAR